MPKPIAFHLWGRWQTPQSHEYLSAADTRRATGALRARFTASEQPSFWFLPSQTWFSSGFQRQQQLARSLAEIGCTVVYCEPWPHGYSLATAETHRQRRFRGVREIEPRLLLLRIPHEGLPAIERETGPSATVFSWPHQAQWLAAGRDGRVVYEIVDDHSLVPEADDTWRATHEQWLRDADVVTATADDLIAQIRPVRPDALLVPNGVRLDDWNCVEGSALPADLAAARRAPVVAGYYGALASWFDWELWLAAARLRPEWSFVLIGYPYDGNVAAVRERIAGTPNVHYLGAKPYAELPAYLGHFDVAAIPFVLNPITHGCSPVKLFEYMAGGRPSVCTPMREILKYRSVRFAATAEEFVAQIGTAAAGAGDPEVRAGLRAEAEANTWRARAELVRDAVMRPRRTAPPPSPRAEPVR